MKPQTYVYFIRNGVGHIKIGYSRNPWARRTESQTGSSHRLEVLAVMPGGRDAEQALHERFIAHRISGEWFHANPELEDLIARVVAEHDQRRPQKKKNASDDRDYAEFTEILRIIFSVKFPGSRIEAAKSLRGLVGVNVRTAENWLSGRGIPNGYQLTLLSRADRIFGYLFSTVAPNACQRSRKTGASLLDCFWHELKAEHELIQARLECPF